LFKDKDKKDEDTVNSEEKSSKHVEDEAGSKVRDMLLFRKSVEKDDDDSEKGKFFKRLLRDSKSEDEELTSR